MRKFIAKRCPSCGANLSGSYGWRFCRSCGYDEANE